MTDSSRKSLLLLILDGWGLGPDPSDSAIDLADTPTWDKLWGEYPRTRLVPHGESVGLTEGQMGNSEVGHLNLGAGRVVYQDLVAITRMLERGELASHERLNDFLDGVGEGRLHFIGLFSDGGVHSHIDHLIGTANYAAERLKRVRALVGEPLMAPKEGGINAAPTNTDKEAATEGHTPIFIHALLDGRDTPPAIAERYFRYAEDRLPDGCAFATLGGRYFGMDRDNRWHRTRLHWEAITCGRGAWAADWRQGMVNARAWGSGDEFITPTVLGDYTGIQPGDSVICFNFRADRMRQLVAALAMESFDCFERNISSAIRLFTFTHYRDDMDHPVLLTYDPVDGTLTEVCSKAGLRVYKSAETEKYAHVTYFFNGGREEPWPGENRLLIPSPKVATYDLKPEMSVYEVTDSLVQALTEGDYDLYVVNFANGDMVGHTGVPEACIKACEAVDACLKRVLDACGWGHRVSAIITADHGNCDVLHWPDGTPHTQHSMSDSPLVLVSEPRRELRDAAQSPREVLRNGGELDEEMRERHRAGEPLEDPDAHPERWSLCDVAPTVLELLGVPKPADWTGVSLLEP